MSDKEKTYKAYRRIYTLVVTEVDPMHDINSVDVIKVINHSLQRDKYKNTLAQYIGVRPTDIQSFRVYVKNWIPEWLPDPVKEEWLHKKFQLLKQWYKKHVDDYAIEKGMAEVEQKIIAAEKRLNDLMAEIKRREEYLNKIRSLEKKARF